MTAWLPQLPTVYDELTIEQRRAVREKYVQAQRGRCFYCKALLTESPPRRVTCKPIDWRLFPPDFQKHPVHLQHDHDTGLTEGAVHAYCNAVMWQYEGR